MLARRIVISYYLVSIFITVSTAENDQIVENTETTCQCVPLHMCADNDANINGEGMLDIRMDEDECPNYFETCCDNVIINSTESVTVSTPFKGCGFQGVAPMNIRITSPSDVAEFAELPWTVAILIRDIKTDRNMYKCGGSLLHPQAILTAAHCVANIEIDRITIRAGEHDTKSYEEPLPHQDIGAAEIMLHPRYNSASLKNDIALVFLAQPFDLANNIGTLCVAKKSMKINKKQCIASGWGKDSFKKGKHSNVLKKVEIPIVPRDICIASLRKTRLGNFYNLHRSFICAGGQRNKDTCKGDGGSPLVCPINGNIGRYVQTGIVSWGIGCGDETPGVYVNVQMYTEWIDKHMISRNFDTKYYTFNS